MLITQIQDKLCPTAVITYVNSCSSHAYSQDKHLPAETDLYTKPSKLS